MADSKIKIWISDHVNLTGMKKLTTSLGKVRTSIKKAFNSKPVRNFKIAVLAVTGALIGAVKEQAKMNIEVARAATMASGPFLKNFKELRKQARGLASDYGIASSQMSKGMYDALSAGVSKANLESVMNTAAKIAVADGTEVSTAVDGITTVLNAFGYSAEDSEEVADKLFQTVKQGKTTFGDLAANIATVAPMAAASNIPLEQILAHVAALTASGTPTAQAMTQIRASIQGLNKALGDGWSDNLTYQDAIKKVWSLAGESQTELLKMVGSTEAVQAVLGGVGKKADMAKEKLDAMADSAGATQKAFENVDQFRHWSSFITTAWEDLKKLGGEIDERLAPYVREVTAEFRKWQTDKGLWEKIGGVLDKGEAKLRQIADIVREIKSVEDLKIAGKAIAEKITAYLLEKASDIGGAIGTAIIDRVPLLKGIGAISGAISNVSPIGMISNVVGSAHDARSAAPTASVRDQIVSARAERGGNDVTEQVAEGVKQGIAAVQSEQHGPSDSDKLLTALEGGLTGDALDKAIAGLELTGEDVKLLGEYTEAFSDSTADTTEAVKKSAEAAKKTVEEATKASTANVDSHVKVQDSMRLSSEAALKTAQVADTSQQQIGQAIVLIQQLAAQQAEIGFRLGQTESQIVSMRS